jgi:hypothetical protein
MTNQGVDAFLIQLPAAVRISLGIVFALSVLPKLRQPRQFAKTVVEYRVLPPSFAVPAAYFLIGAETYLAAAFLTGWSVNKALPVASALLALFIVAVWVNLRRGRKISCGCFGNEREQVSARTLVRLFILLAATFMVAASAQDADRIFLAQARAIEGWPLGAGLLRSVPLAVFLVIASAWILKLPELFSLFGNRAPKG